MERSEIKAKEMAPQRLLRVEEVDFKYCNLKREWNAKRGGCFFLCSVRKAGHPTEPLMEMRKIRSKNNLSFSFLFE